MQPHNLHMSPGSSEGRRRPPRLGAVSLLVTDLGVGSTWGVVSKGASVGAEHCSAAHARGPAGESTSGCARQRSGTSAPSSGPRSSCAAALKGGAKHGGCTAARWHTPKESGKASALGRQVRTHAPSRLPTQARILKWLHWTRPAPRDPQQALHVMLARADTQEYRRVVVSPGACRSGDAHARVIGDLCA